MRVREVPRDRLAAAASEDWVDRRRRPVMDGETAWVPVREGEAFDREISPRKAYTGRGYYRIGDIAILHGSEPSADEIAILAAYLRPRGIIWREALDDITRTPRARVVWGESGEVRHRESGYTYILDPARVMFSQGNRGEKDRIVRQIREGPGGERVADMFAGIGYFTIPVAGAGATVHAMEINPVSCGYLIRTATANGLADRITLSPGDCRENLAGIYDRIVMGHFSAPDVLPHALRHIRPGSVLHVHSIGPQEEQIQKAVEGAGFSCGIHVHKVKKYRPHTWHVVQDVTIA